MLIKRPDDIAPSEITPPELFARRREFLKKAAFGSIAGALMANGLMGREAQAAQSLGKLAKGPYSALLGPDDEPTPLKDVTTYNNFYEFGTSKGDPSLYAYKLPTHPWSVTLEGLVKKPKTLAIEDLLKLAPLEDRTYRLRCVEGWSMVIPWAGYPLSALLKQVEPLGSAKYVEFVSFYEQKIMASPFFGTLDWPYVEGLRLDEAMHPLTLLTLGLYGEVLPKQNGAPVRVVVPWKYGFKSGKSIVKIRFVEEQPLTSWNKATPREYGFYSNVNPNVDHPRWSQARERRIGEFLKRPTLMFNGYADQVGQLYTGMDLKRFY